MLERPDESNRWHVAHALLVCACWRRFTGTELIEAPEEGLAGRLLWEAPFAVVSHGTEPDPIFNYGNRAALEAFEMSWEELTSMPSRCSAEPEQRDARARMMERVRSEGFIRDYTGVRISKFGRRFVIRGAVWNLVGADGRLVGQAAMFGRDAGEGHPHPASP